LNSKKKNNDYKNYSVEDFDKYNCIKISMSIYLVLIFVLRGYLVWIISVTNMRDRVAIIQFVYPDTSLFFLSLFSGALGLVIVVLLSLRRPNAATWVQNLWPYCRQIMVTALVFDLVVSIMAYSYWQLLSMNWLLIQMSIVISLIFLCFKSRSLNINLREFPVLLAEDDKQNKKKQ
jgi:uncharacterized membrane protein